MNKFALLCSVSALSLAGAMGAAQAQDAVETDNPFYVSLFAGGSFAQDTDFDYGGYIVEQDYAAGFILGGTIGIQVFENWRIEAEVSHSRYDADGLKVTSPAGVVTARVNGGFDLEATYAMANVWYDFKNESAWTPYLGGGVGIARVSVDLDILAPGLNLDADDTAFAYQLGAGVSYDVTEQITLDVGYRFKGTADADLETRGITVFDDVDFSSHNVQAAIRFKF